MAEGVGVSDEQLDQWDEDTRASVLAFGSSRSNERVLALLGEVRASHAREAEAVADRDELMAEVTAAARRIREAEAERDVLQQRIDKALVALEEIVRYDRQPTMDFSSTDALYNQFTGYLERVEQSWARQATAVRAALTGTGDTE